MSGGEGTLGLSLPCRGHRKVNPADMHLVKRQGDKGKDSMGIPLHNALGIPSIITAADSVESNAAAIIKKEQCPSMKGFSSPSKSGNALRFHLMNRHSMVITASFC